MVASPQRPQFDIRAERCSHTCSDCTFWLPTRGVFYIDCFEFRIYEIGLSWLTISANQASSIDRLSGVISVKARPIPNLGSQ